MIKNVAEIIRKTMGWCPNAGALTIRKSVQFDDLTVNAPGSGGELTQPTAGWWNKYRNRVLIGSIGVTLLAVSWFISYGIHNTDIFLAGLFIGMLYGVLTWTSGLHSLDKIAKSRAPIKTSTKRTLAVLILIISTVLIFGYSASLYGIGKTLAFISGLSFPAWFGYFQVVYWEKKNRRIIVTHGYFKPTVSVINLGDNE